MASTTEKANMKEATLGHVATGVNEVVVAGVMHYEPAFLVSAISYGNGTADKTEKAEVPTRSHPELVTNGCLLWLGLGTNICDIWFRSGIDNTW